MCSPASTAPEVKAPSRAANPAPVSSISPLLWSPRVPSRPSAKALGWPQLLEGWVASGWLEVCYHGHGLPSTVLDNLKCQFIPWHVHKLAELALLEHLPLQTWTWSQTLLLPTLSEAPPPRPLAPLLLMPGRHRLIDAEDFPFLWFFCLFWVYTIIKKSLVLAGNFKNEAKQHKENHPPLAYSSSSKTWQSFFPTLGVGIEGWELHSKKRWRAEMQLLDSPVDIRLSNNNNINNNKT